MSSKTWLHVDTHLIDSWWAEPAVQNFSSSATAAQWYRNSVWLIYLVKKFIIKNYNTSTTISAFCIKGIFKSRDEQITKYLPIIIRLNDWERKPNFFHLCFLRVSCIFAAFFFIFCNRLSALIIFIVTGAFVRLFVPLPLPPLPLPFDDIDGDTIPIDWLLEFDFELCLDDDDLCLELFFDDDDDFDGTADDDGSYDLLLETCFW